MIGPTFISLWAGDLNTANTLPDHLHLLYDSIGQSHFIRDPEVCAERELVPIEELLEPFSLPEEFAAEAKKTAELKSLRLASVVVVVYLKEPPGVETLQPPGCRLCYLGTCTVFKSIWDVTLETAHPNAQRLIGNSFIWDYGNEDSPLGNDRGADTFAAYIEFRASAPDGRIRDFISQQLEWFEIADEGWDLLDEPRLNEMLNGDVGYAVLTRDDFIIGLAFAQLVLEGTVDPTVRSRAMMALSRQKTDIVLSFRGAGGEEERKRQLSEFQRILKLA